MVLFLHGVLIHAVKGVIVHAMCTKITFPAGPVFKAHGGINAVAKALGYNYQRVHNWKARGIPALEVARRPEYFAAAKVGVVNTAAKD